MFHNNLPGLSLKIIWWKWSELHRHVPEFILGRSLSFTTFPNLLDASNFLSFSGYHTGALKFHLSSLAVPAVTDTFNRIIQNYIFGSDPIHFVFICYTCSNKSGGYWECLHLQINEDHQL
ncbi:hypothetical protein ABNavy71_153 [Acinetobacter phage AB-Navy71]|nr:hypothetical protein ABNavy71_153 [Acinetobacter phage AB-Navy71]